MKPITQALLDRIEALVDRSAGPEGCHPWLGTVSRTQPILSFGDCTYYPRRVTFEAKHGRLLYRERVHARCKNSLCLNLAHLMGGFENYFHSQVDRSGGPDACWPWTGMLFKGYGRFGTRHRVRYFAHRVAYELAFGKIEGHVPGHPELERLVMHTCDNPPCCNPAHLRLGTDKDNIADCIAKGRAAYQKARAARSGSPTTSEEKP